MPITLRLLCLAVLAALPAGCAGFFVPPEPEPTLAAKLSQWVYPKDAAYGEDLDIHLVRTDRQHFDLINRTARALPAGQVWINREWVGLTVGIKIGPDNPFDLKQFINEHGELYRVGAVLQPERSFPIVLVEFFDPATGQRHRMVVRNGT